MGVPVRGDPFSAGQGFCLYYFCSPAETQTGFFAATTAGCEMWFLLLAKRTKSTRRARLGSHHAHKK